MAVNPVFSSLRVVYVGTEGNVISFKGTIWPKNKKIKIKKDLHTLPLTSDVIVQPRHVCYSFAQNVAHKHEILIATSLVFCKLHI